MLSPDCFHQSLNLKQHSICLTNRKSQMIWHTDFLLMPSSVVLGDLFRLNIPLLEWAELSAGAQGVPPSPRTNAGMAATVSKLFVLGGNIGAQGAHMMSCVPTNMCRRKLNFLLGCILTSFLQTKTPVCSSSKCPLIAGVPYVP